MSNAYKIIKNFASDKFSPELKEKLWKWLIDSNEQDEKEAAMMELWEEQDFKADASTERSYQNFRRKIAPGQRKATVSHAFRRWAQVAAILLIPLLSIVISYLYIQSNEEYTELVEYYVPRGEQKQILLPDGTTAYLNSGTLLVYPQKFSSDIRSVYLIGEAYFDVKKDKRHPFIVKTNHLKVKVLGTKFNVHAYAEDEKTITTLESGSVVVQKANNEDIITLTPNEQLEYDNPTGGFNKKIIDASVYSGWTKGELNFAAMTLNDIFTTIERIYNIHIIVPPHLATTDVYTIKFKQKAPIRDIMNIVTKTIGNIDYKVEDENILLIYSPLNKKGGR